MFEYFSTDSLLKFLREKEQLLAKMKEIENIENLVAEIEEIKFILKERKIDV